MSRLARAVRQRLRPVRSAYDELVNNSPLSMLIEAAVSPRIARLPTNATVLDIGTGRGHARQDQVRGHYISLDLRIEYRPHVVGDGSRLPFRTGSLDAVCATSVLLLIEHPETMFEEIARVLRPGGVVIAYAEMLHYTVLTYGRDSDLQRYTPGRLRRLTRSFDDVALVPVGSHRAFYANMLWRRPPRVLRGPLRSLWLLVLGLWARSGGAFWEAPLGHVVVARRGPANTAPSPNSESKNWMR